MTEDYLIKLHTASSRLYYALTVQEGRRIQEAHEELGRVLKELKVKDVGDKT